MPSKKLAAKKKTAKRVAKKKRQPKKKAAQRRPAPDRLFPIVGVGASAGGLEALEELLENMPEETGMAFVVVTHQNPKHTSLLPDLLARDTKMEVVEAEDGAILQPNHVYVGPPGGYLAIMNGTLHRMEIDKKVSPHLPIDAFFRSLAEDQKERAICIVLSGTGTDGTLGLNAIKAGSGMAMVQEPGSAKYTGMPSSAIATGLADYVLAPKAMPKQLMGYAGGPFLTGAGVADVASSVPAEPVQKIFVLLRSRTGHDFSSYKSNTIRRRIERRMNVHQITEPGQYVRYLQENSHEVDILFNELLISVTNFFRDPDAWKALNPWLEELVKSRPENHTLRIWIPGCATGEEAFSVAIALRECMDNAKRYLDVQIFATDLSTGALDSARNGQFPDGIAMDVSPERLERYFTRGDDSTFRIRKEIREMIIFSPHNVIKDPPFTKLDLISCRNLMIYLNPELHKKLLPIFHYTLKPDGLLFLGPSETIGAFTDLFASLDKRWKIFQRKECPTALQFLREFQAQPGPIGSPEGVTVPSQRNVGQMSTQIERVLLGRFAPTSVVVNDRGDIIYIHGRTGMYLESTQGQPRNNILEMAREGLQLELASAIRQCSATGDEVVSEDIGVRTNGEFTQITLKVVKLTESETVRGLLLVAFHPITATGSAPATKATKERSSTDRDWIERLEKELKYTKESHLTTLEELDTSSEELRSSNEELQSTNEEMATSKEEMQSLNEELTTVNAELQSKLYDLSQANDDMLNLLNSSDIATVFLDNDLNVKRFTEEATKLVMLRRSDVGRPISELVSNLAHDHVAADCRKVLKTLVFKEREMQTKQGAWYLMRIMPYRTSKNVIDGLVLTFVDIAGLKEAQTKLRRLSKVFMDALDPIVIVDLDDRVVDVNEQAVAVFGFPRSEMLGQPIDKIVPSLQQQEGGEMLARCRSGETIRGITSERVGKDGSQAPVVLTLTLLTNELGEPDAVAMITERVTG